MDLCHFGVLRETRLGTFPIVSSLHLTSSCSCLLPPSSRTCLPRGISSKLKLSACLLCSSKVFWNKEVGALLLAPFTYSHLSSTSRDDDLEKAARILSAKIQYYTATFSYQVFISLLLHSTSQVDPLYYRLLLWRDYSSVVKCSRTVLLAGMKRLGEGTSVLTSAAEGGRRGWFRELILIHQTNIWPKISPVTSGYDRGILLRAIADIGVDQLPQLWQCIPRSCGAPDLSIPWYSSLHTSYTPPSSTNSTSLIEAKIKTKFFKVK